MIFFRKLLKLNSHTTGQVDPNGVNSAEASLHSPSVGWHTPLEHQSHLFGCVNNTSKHWPHTVNAEQSEPIGGVGKGVGLNIVYFQRD